MSDLLVYGPHILVGAAALFFFWRTLLTVKGSAPHRRNGRRYLLLLVPLLATTVLFALQALAVEGPVRVVQLVYLVLVVAAAGWTAWRAIRDRATPERFTGPGFRALAVGLTGMGVLLMVMGIVTGQVLPFGFAMIGVVYGGAMLGQIGRPLRGGWWLGWHLNGVALLFAATHASFVGLVLRHLVPAWEGEVLHALTQLGTIAFAYGLRQALGWRYEGRGLPVVA